MRSVVGADGHGIANWRAAERRLVGAGASERDGHANRDLRGALSRRRATAVLVGVGRLDSRIVWIPNCSGVSTVGDQPQADCRQDRTACSSPPASLRAAPAAMERRAHRLGTVCSSEAQWTPRAAAGRGCHRFLAASGASCCIQNQFARSRVD